MNYFSLTTTTPDVLDKIEEAEKAGKFNEHLDPIDYNNCYPVDEQFPYVPHGLVKLRYGVLNFFVVRPFKFIVNHQILKTKVYGRGHLGNIKNAVVTCNHVNKLDAVAAEYAVRNHHAFKTMVGDFNNQKGKLGDYMRAFGVLPFSPKPGALRAFNHAVEYYLRHKTYILFFPERAEWWCYEKPRPIMDGAFHYAVKNKVPVIPLFITFTKLGKKDINGIEQRRFHVHILEPIYADSTLSNAENVKMMKEKNMQLWIQKYEEFYKKKYDLKSE